MVHGSAGRAYMRACRRAVGRSGGRAVRQAGGRCASEVQETYTTHESQALVVIPMPSQAMARNRSSAGLVGSCTACRRLPPVHWVFIPSKKGTWFGALTFWVKLPRDIESHILARTACLLEVCERLTIDEMPYLVGCNVQIGRPQSSSWSLQQHGATPWSLAAHHPWAHYHRSSPRLSNPETCHTVYLKTF